MNATIKITAQYYENYGFNEGTERWKPKGGADFEVQCNSDLLMYSDEDELIETIKTQLAKRSNEHSRYTYIEHSVVFGKTEELSQQIFESTLRYHNDKRYEATSYQGN